MKGKEQFCHPKWCLLPAPALKSDEILGTVRKCHVRNQFFLSFTNTVVLAQTLVCKTRPLKNPSPNGWYLSNKRQEKQKMWNFYFWTWFLHPARKCCELAAKTALEEHTCNKWPSACWQASVPNIPKADGSQGTPYLEDEHGKEKELYSLSALFAMSYFLRSVSDTEINSPVYKLPLEHHHLTHSDLVQKENTLGCK